MGWSLRVLRHRAAAQRTLLATVVAVALVGASLLGTFALLLFTSENRALDTALNRAPATATDVDAILTLGRTDPLRAAAAGGAFLDDLLGDVPSTRTQWLTSPMYRLPGRGAPPLPWPTSRSAPRSRRTRRCSRARGPGGRRRRGPGAGRRPEGRRGPVRLGGRDRAARAEPGLVRPRARSSWSASTSWPDRAACGRGTCCSVRSTTRPIPCPAASASSPPTRGVRSSSPRRRCPPPSRSRPSGSSRPRGSRTARPARSTRCADGSTTHRPRWSPRPSTT